MMVQVVSLVAVFSGALILTSAAPADEITKCTEENTYTSANSKRISAEVLKFIDKSINPCDDFYQFACGGYIKNNEIPSNADQVSYFTAVANVVLEQLHTILKEPISDNEPKWSKLTKKIFQMCTDTKAINKNGLISAQALLKQLGGWPLVDGDNWKEQNWTEIIYKLRKHGLDTNFLKTSSTNSSTPHIDGKKRKAIINAIDNYLVNIAVVFGANKDRALTELKDLHSFIKDLSKITVPPEVLDDLAKNMTVEELQKRFPFINWIRHLKSKLNKVGLTPNVKVTEKTLVDFGMPKWITSLESLLNKTPKRVLANYLVTFSVTSIAQFLNKEVRDLEFELYKEISGRQSVDAKWKECLELVSDKLKIATSALYARKYFTKAVKISIGKLITNLHEQLIEMLQGVDWMDDVTKNKALTKAKAIREHVGCPDELLDDKILNDYYANLEVSDDYLQFNLNIDKFLQDKLSESLYEVVDRSDWKKHSLSYEVNAFYKLAKNTIVIPVGILQGAFFGYDRPNYMNYGGIGFIAGHELMHGFSGEGRDVNNNGKLKQWWSTYTENAYAEKALCIYYQYNNFTSEKLGARVNGIATLDENIADNGALKLVYEAYEKQIKLHGSEKCLPDLEYTPKQLFWISLANTWCTQQRDEYLKTEMLTSGHTPAIYRIYGLIANSKEFVKDFNCPVNSKMHSDKKCCSGIFGWANQFNYQYFFLKQLLLHAFDYNTVDNTA